MYCLGSMLHEVIMNHCRHDIINILYCLGSVLHEVIMNHCRHDMINILMYCLGSTYDEPDILGLSPDLEHKAFPAFQNRTLCCVFLSM